MPPKCNMKGGEEKKEKGRFSEKPSFSFNERGVQVSPDTIPRPRTVPDLMPAIRRHDHELKLSKLLLNVTIQRSPGAIHVVIPPESTVKDLIGAALRQYEKEARRPLLTSTDSSCFQLHYTQFSLECLHMEEKVTALGSRNFFLCPKESGFAAMDSTSGCLKQVDKTTKKGFPLPQLFDFLM